MAAVKAIWIPVWRVSPDGERVTEHRASLTKFSTTVREVGQTRAGTRYSRMWFDQVFAETRALAIEKFIQRQKVIHGKARTEMELAQLLITRGETLRTQVAQEATH